MGTFAPASLIVGRAGQPATILQLPYRLASRSGRLPPEVFELCRAQLRLSWEPVDILVQRRSRVAMLQTGAAISRNDAMTARGRGNATR